MIIQKLILVQKRNYIEHSCKNPQKNTGISNPTTYKVNYIP